MEWNDKSFYDHSLRYRFFGIGYEALEDEAGLACVSRVDHPLFTNLTKPPFAVYRRLREGSSDRETFCCRRSSLVGTSRLY